MSKGGERGQKSRGRGKKHVAIKLEYKKTTGSKHKARVRKMEGWEKRNLKSRGKEKYRGKEEGGGGEGQTR